MPPAGLIGGGCCVQIISEIIAIVAPVFLVAASGYLWIKMGRAFDHEMVTGIVANLATPFLLFSILTKQVISPEALGEIMLGGVALVACFALLGALVLNILRLPNHSYLPALMFPNCGNLGLPLCYFAFGDVGLALAIGIFTITSLGQFTLGVALASGQWSLKRLAQSPIIYALAAAFAFILLGIKPPRWLANTTDLLGQMAIPLLLVALGASLAQLKVERAARAIGLSLVRLVGGFAVGLGVAAALTQFMDLDPVARGVLILQASMPVAVFNYLFAARYQREPADIAGMVVLTTLISVLTAPLILLMVLP